MGSVPLRDLVMEHGGLAARMAVDVLSQGQKQLFSLARGLLRHRIRARGLGNSHGQTGAAQRGTLLLDEFSCGVGHETDRAMQRAIREEFEAYTVILVSHRSDMVMGFELIRSL